jgi:ATP-dependent DNA ligase
MREPWRDRRKRLADLLERARLPRVGIVPVTDDAAQLYETWVGMGGEGVVLKEPDAPYRPGARSSAWLKLKPKLTLDVVVTGGSELGLRHVPAVGQARWVGQALAQHRRDEGHGKDPGGSLSVPSLVP